MCKLAVGNKYEEWPAWIPKMHSKDVIPNSKNLEDLTGMGFDENNYSPIPPVGKATSQQGVARLTSTPKPMVEADLNISDPTHNRGKVNRVSSFTTTQEQMEMVTRPSKGGPVKRSDARSQTQPSTSTHGNTGRPQVHCTTCGGTDHLRKDCLWGCFLHKMQNKVSHYRNVPCTHENR